MKYMYCESCEYVAMPVGNIWHSTQLYRTINIIAYIPSLVTVKKDPRIGNSVLNTPRICYSVGNTRAFVTV